MEKSIGQTIPDNAPIMASMARWTAELMSKYAPGDDEINKENNDQVPPTPSDKTKKQILIWKCPPVFQVSH